MLCQLLVFICSHVIAYCVLSERRSKSICCFDVYRINIILMRYSSSSRGSCNVWCIKVNASIIYKYNVISTLGCVYIRTFRVQSKRLYLNRTQRGTQDKPESRKKCRKCLGPFRCPQLSRTNHLVSLGPLVVEQSLPFSPQCTPQLGLGPGKHACACGHLWDCPELHGWHPLQSRPHCRWHLLYEKSKHLCYIYVT